MRLLVFALIFLGSMLLHVAPANGNSVQQVRVAVKVNVYSHPAFKSKVIERLNARTVVSFSTNKIVGKGGLGVFYKVKTPNGKIGYIIDSDLVAAPMEEAPAPPPVAVQTPSPSQAEDTQDEEAEKPSSPAPAPTPPVAQNNSSPSPSTFWGVGVASIDYSESVNNQTWHQAQYFLALRRTRTPRQSWRLGSDFTLSISPQAPRFLADAGAFGSTSGHVVIGEFLLHLPLASGSVVPYLGIGPMGLYANYKTNFASGPYESAKFRFGGVANVGLSYEFSKYCLRLDVNYYVESTSYLAQKLTFQAAF